MDGGGVSAVVGSQAWVVSLGGTGGVRVPTLWYPRPLSLLSSLCGTFPGGGSGWQRSTSTDEISRNPPLSLANPRTSHVGRGRMRDIRTTCRVFGLHFPWAFSLQSQEPWLLLLPEQHLRLHGRASPDTRKALATLEMIRKKKSWMYCTEQHPRTASLRISLTCSPLPCSLSYSLNHLLTQLRTHTSSHSDTHTTSHFNPPSYP